jgi:type III restriction enzyme
MELLDFQEEASNKLGERVVDYLGEPFVIGRLGRDQRRVPFLQLLSSITASGKTLILADAVSMIAKQLAVRPVVLWLSKATVVVAQTYANLNAGGQYHDLIDDFEVRTLAEYDESELRNTTSSFLFFTTVGTFNQGAKEAGALNVYKSAIDEAERSTWESLKLRPDGKNFRRPLLVVYDEAHNLSDQQTDLLLDLEPDTFILSTATSRLPAKLTTEVITRLKDLVSMTDADLTTLVDPLQVAASGLVKNEVNLVGRQAPMEEVVADMVRSVKACTREAVNEGLPGTPKAVYICKTNISEETGERDNQRQPFLQRTAPPILIWRHLTEKLRVRPSEIAVYCDLKVDKNYPLPDEFTLFRGGDKDYEQFVKGDYRHIIFNQSLQEGWDDPWVFFAYIDKGIGSRVQAEQIVGRLLRQPGRRHYKAQRLNTAQVFVRVEAAGVFDEVVASVEEKIQAGKVEITITATRPGAKEKVEFQPKGHYAVPVAALIPDRAEKKIAECIDRMPDFSRDVVNTMGKGKRATVQKIVGGPGGQTFEWKEHGESATVLARWFFMREVARVHKGALGVAVTSSPDGKHSKFDARIGFGSPAAATITDVAHKVGNVFIDQVYLKLRGSNPYEVGSAFVDPGSVVRFKNATHKAYDGLNTFELEFAKAIDKVGRTWCRNPPRSGYAIPLVEPGKTVNFYPDFLVWKGRDVYCIDTKGPHLHNDAMRKLVSIKPASGSKARVFVRFVSPGVVDEHGPQPDSSGFTVWSFKPNGSPDFTHFDVLADAARDCLRPDV